MNTQIYFTNVFLTKKKIGSWKSQFENLRQSALLSSRSHNTSLLPLARMSGENLWSPGKAEAPRKLPVLNCCLSSPKVQLQESMSQATTTLGAVPLCAQDLASKYEVSQREKKKRQALLIRQAYQ